MVNLTITIPTYNRPEHIRRQVKDVLAQMRPGVKLVVYDNCSDIPVESLFSAEEKTHFTIYRNAVNIGGGANLGRCFDQNTSDWIWILSDDDVISTDSLDIIVKTIEENPDCCYINFQNKKTQVITSFQEYLHYNKIIGAFGISFFQSVCILNMSKLNGYIRYYYDFLSTWVGQIMMVLKYMEKEANPKCLFTTQPIITDVNEGGWDHLEIIVTTSLIRDRFNYLKNMMRSTLFKALVDMDLTLISQSKESFRERFSYFIFVIRRFGFVNVVRYSFTTLSSLILSVFLPPKLYKLIRRKAASKYNANTRGDTHR